MHYALNTTQKYIRNKKKNGIKKIFNNNNEQSQLDKISSKANALCKRLALKCNFNRDFRHSIQMEIGKNKCLVSIENVNDTLLKVNTHLPSNCTTN